MLRREQHFLPKRTMKELMNRDAKIDKAKKFENEALDLHTLHTLDRASKLLSPKKNNKKIERRKRS